MSGVSDFPLSGLIGDIVICASCHMTYEFADAERKRVRLGVWGSKCPHCQRIGLINDMTGAAVSAAMPGEF